MATQDVDLFLTRTHRIYFAAVALLALYVGIWGYFIPLGVDEAIPWMVPPLHARFLGAMYFSGAALMIGCMRAKRWSDIRLVVPMISVWTGMLFVVSLFYLPEFDFRREQVWIWFAAYTIYPAIAAWMTWYKRKQDDAQEGPALPSAARTFLLIQGATLTLLSLALLFMPKVMVGMWPWAITPMLAQIYSAPFLSYGIGSILHARRDQWSQVQVPVIAFALFALLILVASIIHRGLFSLAEVPDLLWFAGFAILLIGNGTLSALALSKR